MKERPEARLCYDHLGGKAGHLLLCMLLERGWLAARPGGTVTEYQVTKDGRRTLTKWGIDLNQLLRSSRKHAVACIERHEGKLYPHLGAHLGKLLLERLIIMGWFVYGPDRSIKLTELGREVLRSEAEAMDQESFGA